MAWMMDAFSQIHGHTPGIVTGKPVELGGSVGRDSATGRGVVYVTREAANDLGMDPTGARVAIQGFGQVGSWTARIAGDLGCLVTAVSDVQGGIHNDHGIDIAELVRYQAESGTVVGFPGTERITNEELIELDCEILVPAAIDRTIHSENAPRVKAMVVVEAANHPVTPGADDILNDRGIMVIPDVLVNAGGVVVSYFEWTQNLYQHKWDMVRVNDELNKIMTRAYQSVRKRVARDNVTHRDAAFLIAVERVAHVAQLRGFI